MALQEISDLFDQDLPQLMAGFQPDQGDNTIHADFGNFLQMAAMGEEDDYHDEEWWEELGSLLENTSSRVTPDLSPDFNAGIKSLQAKVQKIRKAVIQWEVENMRPRGVEPRNFNLADGPPKGTTMLPKDHISKVRGKAATLLNAMNSPEYVVASPNLRGASLEKQMAEGSIRLAAVPSLSGKVATVFATQSEAKAGSLPEEDCDQRFLNAGIFQLPNSEIQLSPTLPLRATTRYYLGVNIGCFWGLGDNLTPIPAALEELVEATGFVDLTVQVVCPEAKIPKSTGIIRLFATGNTEYLYFEFSFAEPGDHQLLLHLMLGGNTLQSWEIGMKVVGTEAAMELQTPDGPLRGMYLTEEVKKSLLHVLTKRLVYFRTDNFSPETLEKYKKEARKLTIIARENQVQAAMDLHFFQGGESALPPLPTRLTQLSLGNRLEDARKNLRQVMNGFLMNLDGRFDPADPEDRKELVRRQTLTLGMLAASGWRFFRAMFSHAEPPEKAEEMQGIYELLSQLNPGDPIQVAPLSRGAGVPWEMIYDRKIRSFDEKEITLCADWQDHGPHPWECPNIHNRKVVCPHGFWGFRYVIEQLPYRLREGETQGFPVADEALSNTLPLEVNALNFAFPNWPAHLQKLQTEFPASGLTLRTHTGPEVETAFGEENQPDLLYFYAHGGKAMEGPYFNLGSEEAAKKIWLQDLEDIAEPLGEKSYLVFLNTCNSTAYTPEMTENFIEFFFHKNAVGVLGSQCEIREEVADYFFRKFLHHFITGKPLGEALFATRWEMLEKEWDPRGLVYSMFAPAHTHLKNPVLT